MPFTLLRAHRGAAAALALLAFTASLLLAVLPRTFEQSYDDSLRRVLDDSTADLVDLDVTFWPQAIGELFTSPSRFAATDAQWRADLPPALRKVVQAGGNGHYGASTYGTPVVGRVGEPNQDFQFVDLAWLPAADRRVRYVEGAPPGPAGRVRVGGRDLDRVDLALVHEAADKLGLHVGSTLLLGADGRLAARVTGFFELVDPADGFWEHNRGVPHVSLRPSGDIDQLLVTGLTGADSLAHMDSSLGVRYSWVLGLDTGAVTARNAPDVVDALGVYNRMVGGRSTVMGQYTLETGLSPLLTGFLKKLATAQTLMLLILGGLGLVSVGVIVLASQLLTERMRAGLTLMRARGAGPVRIVGTGSAVAALAALPAVLLGYGLAFLVPGPVTPAALIGPVIPALAAIAVPVVRLARSYREPLNGRREDAVLRRPSPRRIVTEVTVVGLALAGAYLLRTRGLTGGAAEAGDPFLMAVPAALTLAAALVTQRGYPYPLRLAGRLARHRAVPFLALAQAARARGAAALAVLILLPALAVSVFGAVVSQAIGDTQRTAAWRQVGASARIERDADISPGTIERVRGLPGVEEVLPVAKGIAQISVGGRRVRIVAVDLAAYRRMASGTPLVVPAAAPGASAGVPALVSPSLSGLTTFELGWPASMTAVNRGTISALPGLAEAGDELIVLPYDAARRTGTGPFANTLLVKGDVDRASLIKVVNEPQVLVVTVADALRKIADSPLTSTIVMAFALVTVALAGYALVAVVIALMIGAVDRARTLAYLRTAGLSRRQARSLTVLEIAPLIVLGSLAGLALGLALPLALAPGIDLSAYAGLPVDGFPISLGTPSLLAAGVTAVAVLGALAHAMTGRAVAGVLQMGEAP
ncbi:hypothetical protein Psi02_68950 [Planotetraspora silvatica]|uniref:ABC3 transporter permease C-terminal domain-containing protein n=1 Tax=Planotetraspora silvatica TaxID=234614 RepID=A0A8J3UTK9_9ACTN|nr:FtsX-like permease family protein [Planotetraspora silvatica]GII50471.1 hypothetical protein Psi02_68950 [Planotetraspora silvatica]